MSYNYVFYEQRLTFCLLQMEELCAFETLRHMMYNLDLRKQFQPNMMPLQVKNKVSSSVMNEL